MPRLKAPLTNLVAPGKGFETEKGPFAAQSETNTKDQQWKLDIFVFDGV